MPIVTETSILRDKTPQAITIHVPFLDLSTIPRTASRSNPPPEPDPAVDLGERRQQKPFKQDRRTVPNDEVEDF